MLIAVMSDSHDNIWRMEEAVSRVRKEGAGMVIHCGDMVAPFMLFELGRVKVPVHAVFGNNDGDHFLLMKVAAEMGNVTFHGLWGKVDAGGDPVAFTHYREVADGLVHRQEFNLVCYGHTHAHHAEKTGKTLLLNPGEMMGMQGKSGFCLVETSTGEFEEILL
ncbi:MAG: metallophosphoesterase family protein [Desulfatibacillum sp.]|nr:metallophosphoesterase family protein [Desulfatibacillum sp.]